MSGGLAIAILAAGGATRFGGGKLDAMFAGKPLGQWALDAARVVENERLAVVVGEPAPGFARGCELLINRRATDGLGTSIALAARWAAGRDALLIVLADMPRVTPETLGRLAKAALSGRPSAVVYPGGKLGVPACFPAAQFPALEQLSGDTGAAPVLRGRTDVMPVETMADELRDVDWPKDLAELAKLPR